MKQSRSGDRRVRNLDKRQVGVTRENSGRGTTQLVQAREEDEEWRKTDADRLFVSFRFVSFLSNRCHRHGQFKVKFAFIPRTSSRTALACAQIKPDLKDVRASSGILPLSFPFDSKPCGPPTPRFQWNDWLHHPSPGQALRRPASCRVY